MTRAVIISTVGTSLFTNYEKEKGLISIEEFKKDLEDKSAAQLQKMKSEADKLKSIIVEQEKFLDLKGEKASAEIASITKFVSEKKLKKEDVLLYFIISDTAHSLLAAQIITEHLKEQGYQIGGELKEIPHLSVDNGTNFEKKGLPALAAAIRDIRNNKELRKDNPEFFINITGGYKGVLPYMYLIAQMYKIPTFYIYENSDDLISLPKMPLAFNSDLAEEYYYFLTTHDKLKHLPKDEKQELLKYNLVEDKNGELCRSGLGDVFCQWVDSEAPESKTTMGKFIEYKLMETYENYKYDQEINGSGKIDKISRIVHGDKKLLNNQPDSGDLLTGQEIDILLIYENGQREAIEIKPLIDFTGSSRNKDDVKNQFRGRVELVQAKKLGNITLTFLLYGHRLRDNLGDSFGNINSKKAEYRQIAGDIPVKFKYIKINRCYSAKAYSKFLDKIIKFDEIKDL